MKLNCNVVKYGTCQQFVWLKLFDIIKYYRNVHFQEICPPLDKVIVISVVLSLQAS